MKSIPALGCILIAAVALLAAGCSTIDSRIKEKSESFAKLSKRQQQMVSNGYIAVSFPQDAVYMALDKPERIIPGDGPGDETWVYANFYSSDGSSNKMGSKIKAVSFSGGASPASGPGARGSRPTYQLDYDIGNEELKTESMIKVHVKFHNARVVDIQIVNDGKAK